MTAYRDRDEPRLEEAFLWYGPFDGHHLRLVVALVVLVISMFVFIERERSVLRSIDCVRPGRCTVVRGGAVWGPYVERTFDTSELDGARVTRTGGKNPSKVLVLERRDGGTYELERGGSVAGDFPRVHAFFADATPGTLSVAHLPDVTDSMLNGMLMFVPLVLAGVFARFAWQARERLRISVLPEHGVLRIERVVFGRPRSPRDVPIAEIHAVDVQKEPGGSRLAQAAGRARVMLRLRTMLDVPVSHRYHPSAFAHHVLARDLREALRLRMPPPL